MSSKDLIFSYALLRQVFYAGLREDKPVIEVRRHVPRRTG
jgi:hypothetical protein